MPDDKRPPEKMIWWGTPEEIESWIERVYDYKKSKEKDEVTFIIRDEDIE